MQRAHWGLDKRNVVPSILPLFQPNFRFPPCNQTHQMALKIRLSRVGTKNEPHYRVVVAEQRSRRDGDAVEQLGSYNPRAKGNPLTIKLDRVDYWVSKGAKPTATMHAMIKRAKRAATATAPATA
jgi:small subunit ribosomal protein S16